MRKIGLGLVPLALLANASAAAQEKEIWSPIGAADNGDQFSLDFSREQTINNEFGTSVIRIWLKMDLRVPSAKGSVKRLSYYEMNCANNTARVLEGRAYNTTGDIIDRYTPPSPNVLTPVRESSMATKIFRIVCKTT